MANLFPRKVKTRTGHAVNRLEVLDSGSPSPLRDARGGSGLALTAPAALHSDPGSHRPAAATVRPVNLTIVRKSQPLRRQVRNIARGRIGAGDRRDRDRKARDEADPLEDCVNVTQSFNGLMRQAIKKDKRERRELAVRVVQRMKQAQVPFDTDTYNLLLKLLCDSSDDECFRVYEQMREDAARDDGPVKPDLDTFRILIRACERTGDYKRAFGLFSEMKDQYGLQPDVSLYNTLMGFCVHTRNEHQASLLFEEMKERRVQPNVHTYNCLMNVFSESPYELLAQMFEDMHKQRIKPNLRTHNTLMRACQRADDYDRCFKFFEDLKHEGIKPDVMTYNILLEMCRDRLDYVQGRKNHQANRRSKEQQLSGMRAIAVLALSLFNEMDERDVRPNTFTYNALMGVLARCADPRVFTVFRAMKEDWKEEEEDRERLQALIESGELPEVDGALALAGLDSQGDVLLEDASGVALRGHYQRLRAGEEDSARINAFGVKPDLTTYQTLIHAAERMGRADAAYEVFEEMKRSGIKPAKETYVKMMDVCVLRNETDRASELFREAKRTCILPDIEMYNAYMNVLAEAGNEHIFTVFDEVCKDYDHLNIKPNQVTYNILIKACCKLRRPDHDVQRGPLDAAERSRLAEQEAEWNQHRSREAFKLYDQMCEKTSPVQPNVDTYNTLIDVCCITKDIARARELMQDMQARELAPTITTYNRYLNVFVSADDDGIVEVFNELKQQLGQLASRSAQQTAILVHDVAAVSCKRPDLESWRASLLAELQSLPDERGEPGSVERLQRIAEWLRSLGDDTDGAEAAEKAAAKAKLAAKRNAAKEKKAKLAARAEAAKGKGKKGKLAVNNATAKEKKVKLAAKKAAAKAKLAAKRTAAKQKKAKLAAKKKAAKVKKAAKKAAKKAPAKKKATKKAASVKKPAMKAAKKAVKKA